MRKKENRVDDNNNDNEQRFMFGNNKDSHSREFKKKERRGENCDINEIGNDYALQMNQKKFSFLCALLSEACFSL